MNFNSLSFLLFFPVVALLHRATPRRRRWVTLLCASYCFYMSWNPRLVLLLLGATAVSYAAALGIGRARAAAVRRALLCAALLVCLGVLFVFKYMDFFLGTAFDLLLPMGISFYTFQTLSYVIDVYRGDFPPERHFGYYALFISFFPQLVAGPIERPGDLLPQLRAARDPSAGERTEGLLWIIRGFAKKVVVSDLAAAAVDRVYGAPEEANALAVVLATVLFAVQIYCDFSGYSEIAVGAAKLLGIELMQNFDRPYAAVSVRDFWRRWHISLTRWFTDYLYIPLGGSRRGGVRRALNTLLVFTVSGLWHGANWTFVAWGLIHGLFVVAEGFLPKRDHRVLTLAGVGFAWVFFRAASLSDAFTLLSRLFTAPWSLSGALELLGLSTARLALLPLLLLLTAVLDREPPRASTRPGVTAQAFLLLAVALGWLIGLDSGAGNSFIYFQF